MYTKYKSKKSPYIYHISTISTGHFCANLTEPHVTVPSLQST